MAEKTAPRMPRIGVRIPACDRVDRVAAAIERAEQLGFDSAWVPDSQLIWRDTWMALALAATRTRNIRLGAAVTNVVTRHPSVVASAVRTLQEIAPGRVTLGLGAGWSSAAMIGLPATRHRDLAAAVSTIRTLLAGGSAVINDVPARLTGAAGACPLYLAAQGPLNLQLAGAAADGVIMTMSLPPQVLAPKLERLRAGARGAGRDPAALEVVLFAPIHVTDDPARDIARFKPTVAVSLRNQSREDLAAAGIQVRIEGDLAAGMEPDGSHVADYDAAVRACDPLVDDAVACQWVDAFALAGPAAVLRARLEDAAARGVTEILLTPLGADGNQSLPLALLEDVSAALGLRAA